MEPSGQGDEATRLRELGYVQEVARRLTVRDLVTHGLIYMVPPARSPRSGSSTTCRPGRWPRSTWTPRSQCCSAPSATKRWLGNSLSRGRPRAISAWGANRLVGFVSSWVILLDYLLLPALLCALSASAMTTVVPGVPAWMWVIVFVAVTEVTNVLGVDVTAKVNTSFLCIQLTILAVFLCWAGVLVMQGHARLSLDPLHPRTATHRGRWSRAPYPLPRSAFWDSTPQCRANFVVANSRSRPNPSSGCRCPDHVMTGCCRLDRSKSGHRCREDASNGCRRRHVDA